MPMIWSEKLKHEGRLEGRQEGRLEGRKEGLVEGRKAAMAESVGNLRKVVLRLLDQRFGRVPVGVKREVAKIDSLDRLTEIAEKVLVVQNLEEMGLGNGAARRRS